MSKLQNKQSSETLKNQLGVADDSQISFPRRMSSSTLMSVDSQLPNIPGFISTLNAREASPQSPSSEKSRVFKNMSKHNLAVFGAKLSSTAASVGVHTKHKQNSIKDPLVGQRRESVFVDAVESLHTDSNGVISNSSPAGSGNNTGIGGSSGSTGTLKSKMFKQSKTDLKSLRIKTDLAARPALNDASPMVRGESTKELDRIAAIGQPNSPLPLGDSPSMGISGHLHHHHHHHHHHPHISFRKRDSSAAILSSSASNSKLASEGTVYSFSQPSNNGQSAVTSLHSFKTVEEATSFMTNSWALLSQRIQPVFTKDEAMRIPVEDVNILVLMHFSAHHALGGSAFEVLNRVDSLICNGLKSSELAPQPGSLDSFADSWSHFYSRTLISLEGIFLPLQLEFEAHGPVFSSAQAAKDYWHPSHDHLSSTAHRNSGQNRKVLKLSIRRQVLTAYRDVVAVPALPMILQTLETRSSENSLCPDLSMQLLRCLTALSQLYNEDSVQKSLEKGLTILKTNIVNRRIKDPRKR